MPAYNLRCIVCGNREERTVPMAQSDTQKCAECGARMVVVISPVGLAARRSTEGKGRST